MPKVDETVINFKIYEDANEYYGLAQAKLPEVKTLTNMISGAGMSGNYDAPTLGHVDAMKMTLNFRTPTPAAIRLTEQRIHVLDFRVAQQGADTATGAIQVTGVKYILKVEPILFNPGNVKPATVADASGEYSVSYFAGFFDGKKFMEISIFDFIYFMSVKDYLEPARLALGMAA